MSNILDVIQHLILENMTYVNQINGIPMGHIKSWFLFRYTGEREEFIAIVIEPIAS
jgi:hypothetical protein